MCVPTQDEEDAGSPLGAMHPPAAVVGATVEEAPSMMVGMPAGAVKQQVASILHNKEREVYGGTRSRVSAL